jgi:hypothetical protein
LDQNWTRHLFGNESRLTNTVIQRNIILANIPLGNFLVGLGNIVLGISHVWNNPRTKYFLELNRLCLWMYFLW